MHRYRIVMKHGSFQDVLYSPYDPERQIYDDELKESVGSTSTYNFSIPPTNPLLVSIEPLATKIFIYDGEQVIYDGRVANDKKDILNTGTVETVGSMSYLADSIQVPFSFSGTISAFITQLVAVHNTQCEAKFQVGSIMDGTIVIVSNEYKDTFTVLTESTQNTLGGYLRVRYLEENSYAIDYQMAYGENSQIVRLGENIVDFNSDRTPEEIYTRIIPLGAELKANDQSTLPKYVTIDGINSGVNFVENQALKAKYGTIVGVKQWKEITDPNMLKSVAQEYINEMSMPEAFDIQAVDLSYVEDGVAAFAVGCNTRIISEPHAFDAEYLLSEKTMHLTNPANDSVTLGKPKKSLSKQVVSNQNEAAQNNADTKTDLGNTIVQTGMTITGAKGGYVVLDTYDDQGNAVAPWQILIMDQSAKEQAKNVIRMNQNGIGFSTNGYNGPYTNAWTIDGNLNATFIRSGTLIIGGSTWNTDGIIRILNIEDKTLMEMSKNGIVINSGELNAPEITGGTLNGGEIIGGKIEIGDGFFYADDEEIGIGGFFTRLESGRDILQSNDGQCGISAEPTTKGGLWLWAGYQSANEYDFVVNNAGQCWAKDFCVPGSGSIIDRISRLEEEAGISVEMTSANANPLNGGE